MPDKKFNRWIREKAKELHEKGWEPGGPREEELLAHWQRVRPRMCLRLGPELLKKLAFVLDDQRFQAKMRYLNAGWPPSDAEEEAQREWLLREPENEG
jgi:hypothetical protein